MIVDPQAVVTLRYVNYNGELHHYKVIPTGRLVRGPNQWHPDVPWLIEARVLERDGVAPGPLDCDRTFDPAMIESWHAIVEPDPLRRAAYLLLYRSLQPFNDAEDFRSTMRGYFSELHKALDSTS